MLLDECGECPCHLLHALVRRLLQLPSLALRQILRLLDLWTQSRHLVPQSLSLNQSDIQSGFANNVKEKKAKRLKMCDFFFVGFPPRFSPDPRSPGFSRCSSLCQLIIKVRRIQCAGNIVPCHKFQNISENKNIARGTISLVANLVLGIFIGCKFCLVVIDVVSWNELLFSSVKMFSIKS